MASPDKTPLGAGVDWDDLASVAAFAVGLQAVVVRLQQELDGALESAQQETEALKSCQWALENEQQVVVRLREALRGLMACLTVNENGLMVVDPDDWAEPWAEAVAVVSPDKPPEPR